MRAGSPARAASILFAIETHSTAIARHLSLE